MTLMMFSFMSITMLCLSTSSPHPLTLTIKVLLLAMSLCLTLAHTTTWYAYMLYMVTVGGMLVMFTYISSLSPNSVFSLKPQTLQLAIILMTTLYLSNTTTTMPNTINTQNNQNTLEDLIKFFALGENTKLLLLLAATLLLTMVVVMTLLSEKKTPMRPATTVSSCMTHMNMLKKFSEPTVKSQTNQSKNNSPANHSLNMKMPNTITRTHPNGVIPCLSVTVQSPSM
uniref:NADH dehydrogenase subunit 6 n=1 Tax=Solenaia carinata TaxID=1903492 RepID=V9NEX2_9BIVA|nr:NADH dehydrogenase subunit 6 [Solenaia carinata]